MADMSNIIFILPILVVLVHITKVSTKNEDGHRISWKGVKALDFNWTSSPNVTEDCLRNKLCVNVSNYPTKIAEWALKECKERGLRGVLERIFEPTQNIDILYTACDISEQIIFPRAAQSNDEKWYFILNLDSKPYQGFYTNRCSSDQCPRLTQPDKSKCTQKYAMRSMIYLDMENKMVGEKFFFTPLCCDCNIFKTDSRIIWST